MFRKFGDCSVNLTNRIVVMRLEVIERFSAFSRFNDRLADRHAVTCSFLISVTAVSHRVFATTHILDLQTTTTNWYHIFVSHMFRNI